VSYDISIRQKCSVLLVRYILKALYKHQEEMHIINNEISFECVIPM
jgi:hypothetical protein